MAVRWELDDSDCPTNAEGIKGTPALATSACYPCPPALPQADGARQLH